MKLVSGILLAVALLSCCPTAMASEYFIYPSDSTCPPNVVCNNLSFFTSDPEMYFTDDTVLYFMEGTHLLEEEEMMVISNISNLTLQGMSSDAFITCTSGTGGLAFFGCTGISVRLLTISHCGAVITDELEELLYDYALTGLWSYVYGGNFASHTLFFATVTNLTLDQLTVQYNTRGRAVSLINTFNVVLSRSTFAYNNIASYADPLCMTATDNPVCYGGNVHFLYLDSKDCSPEVGTIYFVNISDSSFMFGVSRVSPWINGGLGISMFHSSSYGVDVTVNSVNATGNSGYRGANIDFTVVSSVRYYTLTMNNVKSSFGNVFYPFPRNGSYITSDETNGAGFLFHTSIFLIVTCESNITQENVNLLSIRNSEFTHNSAREGSGALIAVWPGVHAKNRKVILENCLLFNNSGEVGSGLLIWQYTSLVPESHLHISLTNITVTDNQFENITESREVSTSAVLIAQTENVTFSNVSISDHNVTGLHTYNALLTIQDTNTTLRNNTAEKGGAIYLRGTSAIIFKPPGNLILVDNTADYGGGLYIDQTTIEDDRPLCFFQIDDEESITTLVTPNSHIYSFSNRARVTGDFMYSTTGRILNCRLVTLFVNYRRPSTAFHDLIIYDKYNDTTTISSDPIHVCFCNEEGQPNCTEQSKTLDVIPGSYYDVTVAAVGFEGGLTPGILSFVENVNNIRMNESVYRLGNKCTKTTHFLQIVHENMTIELKVDQSTVPFLNEKVTISLNLLPCPRGYQFSPSLGICDCDAELTKADAVTCNSTTWNITRSTNQWISYDTNENCTIVYSDCPFDYCNRSSVTYSITSPDPQCLNNRAGVLCGECAEGFSLILGSNACRKCNNYYLLLILVFILAGILLVLFIFALDLTVTVGAINGLIFYANVVKINEGAFFPNGPIPVLSQFISWLNLDFGFEVCFYDGMDAFTKVLLQFLFPLYIGSIVVLIIILCKYSQTVLRLAGNHTVPVLATLILLSYTKILRTIIAVMQMGFVSCSDHIHSIVWLLDGTVTYFYGKHGVLLIIAATVFILVAVPYTLLILFIPLLEKKTPTKLRWIMKLKPYFDATCGELRDEYRFWAGFLLLVRLILAVVIPFSPLNADTSVILIATLIIMAIVWNFPSGGVYKKRYLNVLESWFLFLTGLISVTTLGSSMFTGVITTGSLAFVTFILIVGIHIGRKIKKSKPGQLLFNRLNKKGIFVRAIIFLTERTTGQKNRPQHSYMTDTIRRKEIKRLEQQINNDEVFVMRRRDTMLYNDELDLTQSTVMSNVKMTGNNSKLSEPKTSVSSTEVLID